MDLPEVISLRKKLLPEACNDIYLPHSMFETEWMDVLRKRHPDAGFAFVIEGVLMYFDQEDVSKIFLNLAERFPESEIYFDVVNTWMSKHSHIHDTVKFTNASFKFGCDDDRLFERWDKRLRHRNTKLYTGSKAWNRTGILGFFMKIIPRFRYASRMLCYQVKGPV